MTAVSSIGDKAEREPLFKLPSIPWPAGTTWFAFRTWIALAVGLYAAFWLELEGASSAGVCVLILAQPAQGMVLSKSIYRFAATVIGVIVAIALTSLFPQDRTMLLASFAVVMAIETALGMPAVALAGTFYSFFLFPHITGYPLFIVSLAPLVVAICWFIKFGMPVAQGAYQTAQANLEKAKVNLERTEVRSTVNGYVTNLQLRIGDYANTGSPNISVVDSDSFWVTGYFEETKMGSFEVGDAAKVDLMGYRQQIDGHVESITRGIATSNAAVGTQGLPSVQAVYTWVRLAQRIPVRIKIDRVPPQITLAAGMTATIIVTPRPSEQRSLWSDIGAKFAEIVGSR